MEPVEAEFAMSAPSFAQRLTQESAALRRRLGFTNATWLRTSLFLLIVLAGFGVFLPFEKGVGFLDPVILGAYACFGVVFSGPTSAHDFEGSDRGGAFARILVCVLYGELLAVTILFAALATVYATRSVYVGPDLPSLAMCALFGLALSLAVSTVAVWMSLQYSQSAARGVVRLIFLVLLIGFFFRSRRLPAVAPWGAGIALAVATVAFLRLREAISEQK
jgi:hypothetical protein